MDRTQDIGEQITPDSYRIMNAMGGWMRFIGISAIVMLSLGCVAMVIGLVANIATGSSSGTVISLVVLVFFCLFIWVFMKLLKSGAAFRAAALTQSPYELEVAMRNQKIYFMVTVIFTILSLVYNVYVMGTGGVESIMDPSEMMYNYF